MGIVSDVIAAAYIESWLSSVNVVAAPAIRYCDDIYQELLDIKKLVNEDYSRKKSYSNTVAYTNVYDLPADFEKMKEVSIKYQSSSYDLRVTGTAYEAGQKVIDSWKDYVCLSSHTAWATFAWDSANRLQIYEWYKVCTPSTIDFKFPDDYNQLWSVDFDMPKYYYFNDSLYIYPFPQEAVVDGIIFDYIPEQTTLTVDTEDADINIEPKLVKHWIMWVAAKFRWHVRDFDWQLQLEARYEQGKMKCEERWIARHYWPLKQELPSSLLRYMR